MMLSEFIENNKKAIVYFENKKYIVKKFLNDHLFNQTQCNTEEDAESIAEYWVAEKLTGENNGN